MTSSSACKRLFVFGLGYSACRFLDLRHADFSNLTGTVRAADKAQALMRTRPWLKAGPFDDRATVLAALADSDCLLVSIPPDGADPTLTHYGDAIAASPVKEIVYLSTIGVYGDHDGAWINEETQPAPREKRTRDRISVEQAWLDFGKKAGVNVCILRLAGIYGPGRNAFVNLRAGRARRIVKPGQVFNRIHADDIANVIAACFSKPAPSGVYNVADNEPAPPQDVILEAARRMGVAPPEETLFDPDALTPMARSFWGANKRISNRKMRDILGVNPTYPSYREGLASLMADAG